MQDLGRKHEQTGNTYLYMAGLQQYMESLSTSSLAHEDAHKKPSIHSYLRYLDEAVVCQRQNHHVDFQSAVLIYTANLLSTANLQPQLQVRYVFTAPERANNSNRGLSYESTTFGQRHLDYCQ